MGTFRYERLLMIIDELFWRNPSPSHAPAAGERTLLLSDPGWPQECEIFETRLHYPSESMGLLLDLRTGLLAPPGHPLNAANTAVTIIHEARPRNVPMFRFRLFDITVPPTAVP
jgi:hypothetical protein